MIDVMAKRISSSKRQIMYLFYILLKYIRLKELWAKGAVSNVPFLQGKTLFIVSGRAPHSSFEGKKVIEAIYKVMKIVNEDPQTRDHMRLIFVPNFNVAICEQFVAAADLSQHITTPGQEPSGTSNMKYVMNGGLIVGSRDGANLEIEKELGQKNVFMFGSDKLRLFAYQKFLSDKPEEVSHIDVQLRKVFDYCSQSPDLEYIKEHFIKPFEAGRDPHGVCLDFVSYKQAMDEATRVYFACHQKVKEVFQTLVIHTPAQ